MDQEALTGSLLAVDLGPGASGYFTTRGPVPWREGGPYAGFNLALHVGDDPARVESHRGRLARELGATPGVDGREGIAWMNQVHSASVAGAVTDAVPTADALVLDIRSTTYAEPDVGRAPLPAAAAVLVADCVPLLLAGAGGEVVAAVHAGRRGLLGGIVPAAVGALVDAGAEPSDIWAAIGPSICGACYEVGADLHDAAAQAEPACASTTRWGTPGIDLAAGVTAQLEHAGVRHILDVRRCTYEDGDLFSYRHSGVTGRQAGVVVPMLR
ncbi:polyphenol oxidase family protein [Actinomyces sp.]|uniref:polyphenol oxidase family protein n=1 Tax=Actinomyces sp. TaxID=29317 RepID=UPI0026DCDD96|nr:polyphenol oxidase family protein [Actinomyces sp.]MDO4899603.1 polyphenol oxidase family protein [Actinomyces sp.]